MNNKKDVEIRSKLASGNFSKKSNKGTAPKASDIIKQIANTTKKKEGE